MLHCENSTTIRFSFYKASILLDDIDILELMHMQTKKVLLLLTIFYFFQGCSLFSSNPAEMITGTWQSTVAGFTLRTTYLDNKVWLDGHKALTFNVDGDQITYDGDKTTERLLEFPSYSKMIQVDSITGTRHVFNRVGYK